MLADDVWCLVLESVVLGVLDVIALSSPRVLLYTTTQNDIMTALQAACAVASLDVTIRSLVARRLVLAKIEATRALLPKVEFRHCIPANILYTPMISDTGDGAFPHVTLAKPTARSGRPIVDRSIALLDRIPLLRVGHNFASMESPRHRSVESSEVKACLIYRTVTMGGVPLEIECITGPIENWRLIERWHHVFQYEMSEDESMTTSDDTSPWSSYHMKTKISFETVRVPDHV